MLGEDYDILSGIKIDIGRKLLINSNITDTSTLDIGEHSIVYSTYDINGQKISATRIMKVLHPIGDEDKDGYTNEEELKNGKDPLDGKDIPEYTKDYTIIGETITEKTN